MTTQHTRNLAWLDRLSMTIPGYGGYQNREHRRQAAFALRDALQRRLHALKNDVQAAIRSCVCHDALTEIGALERIDGHIDRILKRLEQLGLVAKTFYEGPDMGQTALAPVYELDHAIIETADHLAHHFTRPNCSHDFLAEVQQHLAHLEHQLDERVRLIQSL